MTDSLRCKLGFHKDEANSEVTEDGALLIFMECKRCERRGRGYRSTFRPGKKIEAGQISADSIYVGSITAEEPEQGTP
ncbi:MAG: hypothetical protein NXH70_02085 [Hyphomonas sp.]|nr:hypothetical protein [Hyphomonas sp.]